MAKKLIFQKSGGNNISIDEENLTANEWTAATFSDFGKYTPVFFNGKLYFNKTGTFTATDPATDTTNWEEIGQGGGIGGILIQEEDMDVATTAIVNFRNNVNAVENASDATVDLYTIDVVPTTGTGVSQIVPGTVTPNLTPEKRIRNLEGETDEIVITAGTSSSDPNTLGLDSSITTAITSNTAGVESLVGTNGDINNITNVSSTAPTNRQILQYDTLNNEYQPVDPPTDSVTTFEGLEDVDIPNLIAGKVPFSVTQAAQVDIETINAATTLSYGIMTTEGLIVSGPANQTAIDQILFILDRNQGTNSVAYSVTGRALSVTISFANPTTTFDDIYTRSAAAFSKESGGPWEDGTRTISGIVYTLNGDFTKVLNPRFSAATPATVSIEFRIDPTKTGMGTDSGACVFNVTNRPDGNLTGDLFNIDNQNVDTGSPAVDDVTNVSTMVAQIATRFNSMAFNPTLAAEYSASAQDRTLTITAINAGAGDNGTLSVEVLDTTPLNGVPSDNLFIGTNTAKGVFADTLTGGTDQVESSTTLQWVDTDHSHSIAKPSPLGTAELFFKQGGALWVDRDYRTEALEDISSTLPINGQILEYDSLISAYKPVDVPSGIATTFEALDDVNIPVLKGDQVPFSNASQASINLETTINTTEIFGVATSNGLLFTTPSGSNSINELLFLFGRDTSEANSYELVDNELRILINFSSPTTSFSEIYAACEASIDDIAFPDGERTISGIVVHRNGDWTNPPNPAFEPAAKASGSIGFSLNSPGETDTGRFHWSISNRQGGNIAGTQIDIVNAGTGDENADIQTVLDDIVTKINGIGQFNTAYVMSRSGNSLVMEALNTGAQDNARLNFIVIENGGRIPFTPSSNFTPNEGSIFVTGGITPIGSETLLKWTDDHAHVIAKPTSLFSGRVSFKQGGFSWTQTDYKVEALTDVNSGSDSGTQRQMLRKNVGSDTWNYVNARIENLNVDGVSSHPGALVQGTVLQYAPSGNGTWEYAGLQDNGSGDFNTTPSNGQVMVYNFQGGINPVWTAADSPLGEAFFEFTGVSNSAAGLVPFTVNHFDATLFNNDINNRIEIKESGAYGIEFAFDFDFSYNDTGTANDNYILEVRKNDASAPNSTTPGTAISVNDYAHGFDLDTPLAILQELSIATGTTDRGSGRAGPTIVDLVKGDFITLTYYYTPDGSTTPNGGVIGIGIANHNGRKPWIKINRV